MHNPLRGVVTSEHQDDGGYRGHQGRDIGARDASGRWIYGVGQPVYAAFSGWVRFVVRWSYSGNSAWTWAPHKTGNGMRIQNPDGEGQGYNHMLPVSGMGDGRWVNEGDLIGHLDLSGNMSAPHLHFETWANWRDYTTAYSPKTLFDKYDVDTMSAPGLSFQAAPAEEDAPLSKEEVAEIKKAIKASEQNIVMAVYDKIVKGTQWASMEDGVPLKRALSNIQAAADEAVALGKTTSRTSAWGVNPESDEQEEMYLSGLLQSIYGSVNALVEASSVDRDRLAVLSPAVKLVKKD